MNCNILSFSKKLSDQRIDQAENLFGRKIVNKILAYALFLLGAHRSKISSVLNIPPGSIRSLVFAMNNRGLSGFEDQRAKNSSFKPHLPEKIKPILKIEGSWLKVDFTVGDHLLQIPGSNPVQKRIVLLSLLNSGLLDLKEVADALHLSVDRTGKLARKLEREDFKGVLDKRQGQKQDYRVTPEVKAELIQQFIIETVAERPTGAEQLSGQLKERCKITLSPRSILSHLSKLGLYSIKDSLSDNLSGLKKNPKASQKRS